MKLFLWHRLWDHGGAPAVIVAENLEDARRQLREESRCPSIYDDMRLPDRTYQVDPYSRSEVIVLEGDG